MKNWTALLVVFCMLFSCVTVLGASQAAEQVYTTEAFAGEIVIPVTEKTGEWKESTAVANYDGGSHYWTSTAGNSMIFQVEKVGAGNYEAYYWVMPHEKDPEEMELVITHSGKTSAAVLHTKLKSGEKTGPGWVSFGVYDFQGTGNEAVTITSAGSNIRASAVKLVPTGKSLSENEVKEETKTEENENKVAAKSITEPLSGVCIWEGGEGSWRPSSSVLGPMAAAPQSLWIAGVDEKSTVTYYPQLETAGNVEISVYLLYWKSGNNPQVKYEVHHNGKTDEFILDPTSITESCWVTLGTFDFSGNPETEFVKLICVAPDENYKESKLNTRASTIRFTPEGTGKPVYVSPDEMKYGVQSVCAPLNTFSDMTGHWAHYDVEYMANEGLVQGKEEGKFDPEAQITRAEYITILDRAMGYTLVTGETYADVPADAWYAAYVATAKENGLLSGLPTEEGFKPEQPITREEMALFTYNAIRATKKNDEWVAKLPTDYAKFTDTDKVSDWAKDALQYLIQTGIIKGTSDTTVSAKENATRAQGAVILKRFMQSFVWAGPPTDEEWVLTFNDEFLGDSVDWSVWQSDARSQSNLMSSRWPENAVVEDGALHLEVKREDRGDKEWTAGNIWVRPEVFAQSYGYWEARYKIAASPYVNNAFWTYVAWKYNIYYNGDKQQHFELDINEGRYPNVVCTTYHSDAGEKRVSNSQRYYSEYDLSADYHTYALEWNEDELIYYFDGEVIFTTPNINSDELQFPFLSTALNDNAGSLPANEFAEQYLDGAAQVVDYVRIWQRPLDAVNPERTVIGNPMEGFGPTDSLIAEEEDSKADAASLSIVDNTKYASEIIIPGEHDENWKTSTAIPGYNGGAHYWTNTKDAAVKYPLNALTGKYELYYWMMPYHTNATPMELSLKQGESDTVVGSVASKTESEEQKAEPGWTKVGEIVLTGEKDANIYCVCKGESIGGGKNLRSSAIKLVPVQ